MIPNFNFRYAIGGHPAYGMSPWQAVPPETSPNQPDYSYISHTHPQQQPPVQSPKTAQAHINPPLPIAQISGSVPLKQIPGPTLVKLAEEEEAAEEKEIEKEESKL